MAADNEQEGKDCLRNKEQHCHPQSKAEQHKPAYSSHILIVSPILQQAILHHMQKGGPGFLFHIHMFCLTCVVGGRCILRSLDCLF